MTVLDEVKLYVFKPLFFTAALDYKMFDSYDTLLKHSLSPSEMSKITTREEDNLCLLIIKNLVLN
jgi:hypothetical protein